jgi:hypothetical protein
MIFASSIIVVLVKRLAAVVIVFLVLGLTASSATAASDVVPKSTQGTPQTVECPCCSENVKLCRKLLELGIIVIE